jgi:hypothetical protein
MHNLSLTQALEVWSTLDDAYYEGASVELYLYQFMPHNPAVAAHKLGLAENPHTTNVVREVYTVSKESAHNVFQAFCRKRRCDICVNGVALEAWYADDVITDRLTIRVEG